MRSSLIKGLLIFGLPALAQEAAAQDVFSTGVTIFDANPAIADLYVLDDTTIAGKLCVGSYCGSTQGYGSETIRIFDDNPHFRFEDSSISGTTRDWSFQMNDSTFEFFMIYDNGADTYPFLIDGGAPSRALQIRADGNIATGSTGSSAAIHITRGDTPRIRFEQDGSNGNTPHDWDIMANDANFFVNDDTNNTAPFIIYPGSGNDDALTVGGNGQVGFGTNNAQAQLHVFNNNGAAQVFVQETSAATTPRTLMNLQNNGRPEIVMGNTGTGGEWSFGAGTKFILKQGAVGSASSAKTKLFDIDASGNATLAGTLTTGGTTCGGGCDLVFSDSYDLPSISEHAEAMFALGHLPNVGPTHENTPINVSDKLGRMLNELEHAHIYIARQEARLSAQQVQIEGQAQQLARLEALLARGQD